MDKGNFTAQDNFPQSTYTLDFLQQMSHLAGKLAALGGANYILSGCVVAGDNVSSGLIVINGEILPFDGGSLKSKITIQETTVSDNYAGVNYPEAYLLRKAVFSDTGEYNWEDFAQVLTNLELKKRFDAIKGDTPGMIKMWSGLIEKIPKDYKLCDGSSLLKSDYPELYENLDVTFGGNTKSFKLPNLKNKFIVGFDVDKPDYNQIGKTGGEELHALTADENGKHQHIVPWGENLNSSWKPEWGFPSEYFNDRRGYNAAIDNDNTWPFTSPSGKGTPHENRPPYFVLAYIIKVK